MRSGSVAGFAVVVCSMLVSAVVSSGVAEGADCTVPDAAAGGTCAITCTGGQALVRANGIGVGVELSCPTGPSLLCLGEGIIPDSEGDPALGCAASATATGGSFSGDCTCRALGVTTSLVRLATSARCTC
jgi:hypothetical protein